MTSANETRSIVMKAYPHSATWKERVSKMSDKQVTAIYIRLKAEGKL